MAQAVFRLFAITLSVVFLGFLLTLGLRNCGEQSRYAEPRHPLAERKWLMVSNNGDQKVAPAGTLPALKAAAQAEDQKIILGLDVQQTLDGEWVVYTPTTLEEQTNGHGVVAGTLLKDLRALDAGYHFGGGGESVWRGRQLKILRLREVLDLYPKHFFMINILNRIPEKMSTLVDTLKASGIPPAQILIQSPFATATREVRKGEADWLIGIDPAGLDRFLIVSSVRLESIADFNADFVVSPVFRNGRQMLTPRVMSELKNRHKWILVDVDTEAPREILSQAKGIYSRYLERLVPLSEN